LTGYFNGHEKSLWVMLQSLAQTFLIRLPVAWVMSNQPNASLTNIGFAAPLATTFGICLNLVYFIWFARSLGKTEHSE
jgi:Na+-driven multidrug efflux pump